MAATVSVKETNGATPTNSTVTAVRYCTSDAYDPGTANPLVKPAAAGTNYSYWKHHYLNADTAPSGGINNVKWFTDGTIGWTGCTLYVGTSASYIEATGTKGDNGTHVQGTSGVLGDGTDSTPTITTLASTKVTADPLSVGGSIAATTGKISDYVITQVRVADTAVAGTLSAETITWRYDET